MINGLIVVVALTFSATSYAELKMKPMSEGEMEEMTIETDRSVSDSVQDVDSSTINSFEGEAIVPDSSDVMATWLNIHESRYYQKMWNKAQSSFNEPQLPDLQLK